MASKRSERMAGEVELGAMGPIAVRIEVPWFIKVVIVATVISLSAGSWAAISYQHESFGADFWVEFIPFFLPILGAGFAGYGAAHAAEQSRLRLLAEEKMLHRAMIQRTIEALRHLDDSGSGTDDRIKIKLLMTSGIESKSVRVDDATSVETYLMAEHLDDHGLYPGDLRRLVGKTLGKFEEFALSIRYGHIHERLAYDSMALVVKNFHSWFGMWMAAEGHKTGGAYCDMLALAKAWNAEKSVVTGESLEHQDGAVQKARDAHGGTVSTSQKMAA